MEHAEFFCEAEALEICGRIETGIQAGNCDFPHANDLLELESNDFRSEIEEAIEMEEMSSVLGRSDSVQSSREEEAKYYSKRSSLGKPLESFYCPITREVMEDPAEISSGQTFERRAIEKWLKDGNSKCPLTMLPLDTGVMRPNNSLRKAIEEWKERNTMTLISSIKTKLDWGDDQEVITCLGQLQELCEERESNRKHVMLEGYFPILVGFLSGSNLQMRNCALSILCLLAKDSDENKEKIAEVSNAIEYIVCSLARRSEERKLAVALLLELSKSSIVRGNVGNIRGCILLLATILSSDNNQAANDARELLDNLSFLDENVVQMAKANYFRPLLKRLESGSDDTKKTMLKTLAEVELTDHSKAILFKDGALQPLLKLVSHADEDMQAKSVKALENLSTLPQNALQMIRVGAVRTFVDILRQHFSSSPSIWEWVAATIMNLAVSAKALEAKEAFALLESDDDIFWLFSLINITGPKIQQNILQMFCALFELPSGKSIRAKLMQCSAIQVLIPYCQHNDFLLRAKAMKLLSYLIEDGDDDTSAEFLSQSFLETLLSIILTSINEEEIASAMTIISNLPIGNTQIDQWLVDSQVVPIIVKFLEDARHNMPSKNQLIEKSLEALCLLTSSTLSECQKRAAELGVIPLLVHLLGSGTSTTKQHASIALAQFSERSHALSRPIVKRTGFFCCSCSPPPEMGCPVHIGVCLVESSFCLLEADAVGPLVRVLGEIDPLVCEAALKALSTLIEGERLQSGIKVLCESSAILPIIKLLSSQSTDLQLKTLHVLERIFRQEECKKTYGASAQMPLVDITQRGTGATRAMAARVLAHLDVLHEQSSYF